MKNLPKIKIFIALILMFNSSCQILNTKKSNEVNRLLTEGNKAFEAKDYDKAIYFYDEGLKIAPDEPALFCNKSQSIRLKAIEAFNASLSNTNQAIKDSGKIETGKKLEESLKLADTALKIIKDGIWVPVLETQTIEEIKLTALVSRSESLRMLAIIVDRSRVDEALKAAKEYINQEPDKSKKTEIHLLSAKMLIDAQKGDSAVIEFKKILETEPNNIEALLGVGMSLAQLGNQNQLKEAKDYLQKFLQLAPQNHPKIATAKEILKATEN